MAFIQPFTGNKTTRLVTLLVVLLVMFCGMLNMTSASACEVVINSLQFHPDARTIVGIAERGPDCTTSERLKLRLKQDRRFWFDRTIEKKTVTVRNGDFSIRHDCKGRQSQKVYFEIDNGKKIQSKRITVALCR